MLVTLVYRHDCDGRCEAKGELVQVRPHINNGACYDEPDVKCAFTHQTLTLVERKSPR